MPVYYRIFIWMSMSCWALTGQAQEREWDQRFVDSILPRLAGIRGDSNAVDQLRKLSEMYTTVNPDSCILFADRADSIAGTIQYYSGQVLSLVGSAMADVNHSNWASATLKMNKAMAISQEHEPDLLLLTYNIMFAISGIKGEFPEATKWKNLQLGLIDQYKGPDWVRWPTYMQLTIFYNIVNQEDSANYYTDSLWAYLKKYQHQSKGIKRDSYMVLGSRAAKAGNTDLALMYYWYAPFYYGLAEIYRDLGNRDSSIYYAKKELETWTRLKSPHNIMTTAKLLAAVYDSIDFVESNKYLKIYINALESFYGTDKQLAQVRVNQERLENELKARDADNRNKISMIVATAIVIFLFGFSLLLWRNNRFKQRANQQLEASFKALKSTQALLIQSEKMASLGELTAGIAHEIQNPLNFVNNFSEVNSELISEIKREIEAGNLNEVKLIADDLAANMEKITVHGKRADAIVKSMLQHSRTSSGEKEPTDINALADEYLRLSYHGIRAKDKSFNAALHTDFDESIGDINIIAPDISRVLLNIYNNAFHAVAERKRHHPDGYNPEVTVTTKKKGELVEISISDNGVGIPEKLLDKIFQPFFTTKPQGREPVWDYR